MRLDWNQDGRRLGLFNRIIGWWLIGMAVLIWLPSIALALRGDWTIIFMPLIFAVIAVAYRMGTRQAYAARPDYAAIARMEREIYGEAFDHDGAPKPAAGIAVQSLMAAAHAERDALMREITVSNSEITRIVRRKSPAKEQQ